MKKASKSTIVFVLPIGMTLGGSNSWSLIMAEKLAALGHRAVLLEHPVVDWHPRLDVSIPNGVELVSVPGCRPLEARRRDVNKYVDVYEQFLPAVFVPNYSVATYAACAALVRKKPGDIRVVGIGHGQGCEYYDVLQYYESAIQLFIATNRSMATKLANMMPHRRMDIVTRACSVEVPKQLVRSYSQSPHPLQLTYAGRITDHEKRVSNLVRLVRALNGRHVNYRLSIIGDGPYRPWLCHELDELNARSSGCVNLAGMLLPSEVPAQWNDSDVSLLVSNSETTGMSLLEGMAHGCVPVSTDCGGPSEFVNDGENGYLVDIDDMETMADRIARLDRNRVWLNDMGNQAYRRVYEDYSYESYVPWFEEQVTCLWQALPGSWESGRKFFPDGYRPVRSRKQYKSLLKYALNRFRYLFSR